MYFLPDYPVVLENISRHRCTMAYIEANSIRTSNSHVYWSMRSCETNLRWLLSNTPSEISPKLLWEKLKTNLEQNQQRPALVVMRKPGFYEAWVHAKSKPITCMTEDLNWAEDKGGEAYVWNVGSRAPIVHQLSELISISLCARNKMRHIQNFFESVERLDSLSRFFWGRIETRPGRIWTAITMHLWSIDSQSQREVLFTWWALE